MNLNRLHRIFGRNRTLSRQDIDTYGKTDDSITKNTIERLSMESSFEQDALEGWEEVSYDTGALSNLDRKFIKTSVGWGWTIVGVVSIIVATVFITNFFSKPSTDQHTIAANDELPTEEIEKEIILEESDILIPDEIQQYQEAPKTQQVEPETIKNEFVQINEIHDLTLQLDTLPLEYIDIQPEQGLATDRITGKEIYLHDLKLLDYSKYRNAPTVKTKQIILTGTPANLENDQKEDYDGSWRVVHIPYMDFINKSIAIFNRGSYKKALTRFETVINSYPDDLNANFYSGLCYFNFGEYTKAIERFNSCMESEYNNFDEESLWMIAQSYDHIGKKTKADKIYRSIIKGGGFYKDQAEQRLKR